MQTVSEIEKLALELPETDRAVLASALLGSLSPVLDDEDEGIAEALRRDAELEADPSLALSLEQLDRKIASTRSWSGTSEWPRGAWRMSSTRKCGGLWPLLPKTQSASPSESATSDE